MSILWHHCVTGYCHENDSSKNLFICLYITVIVLYMHMTWINNQDEFKKLGALQRTSFLMVFNGRTRSSLDSKIIHLRGRLISISVISGVGFRRRTNSLNSTPSGTKELSAGITKN